MELTDTDKVLRDFLLPFCPIGGETGVHDQYLFASANLPPGYVPNAGPCHLFNVRGESLLSYDNRTVTVSYQFQTYAVSEREARAAALALVPVLNDAKTFRILASRLESGPHLLNDPETEWPFALSFYSLMFLNVQA